MRTIPAIVIRCGLMLLALTYCPGTQAQSLDPAQFMQTLEQARRLSADKKYNDAAPLWASLAAANPVNGEFVANLANAYYNLAQYDKAIEAYGKQLELGYGLVGNAAYNIACCYALSGNKEKAIEWVRKALYSGFNNFRLLHTDTDLQSIRSEPAFKKLSGTDDVSRMGRTEGWHYDMELLKQEVMRKAYMRRDLSLDAFNQQYNTIYNGIDIMTDVQVILSLMKMMETLKDGHTGLFPPSRKEFQMTMPLLFYTFKEGTYIIAADPKYKQLLGMKVTGIEGKSMDAVTKAIEPLINRDNPSGVVYRVQDMMRYTGALNGLGITADAGKAELQMQDAGGKTIRQIVLADTTVPRVENKTIPAHWVTLHESNGRPVPLYFKNTKANYWFELAPGTKTVYLQWNLVRNDSKESLAQFTDRLMKYIGDTEADKLVIDLRWNNGGNTLLTPYFINAIIKNDRINKRGKLFVITGRRTFSAAQNLSTYLERHTNAIFVGEPTGSSPNFVGEEDFILLPYSKVAANVSDLYWQSSWPGDHRIWIAPLLYIPPSFKAYSENRDEALDAILSWK